MQSKGLKNYSDILDVEKIAFSEREIPTNSYDLIKNAASKFPHKVAIRFIQDASKFNESIEITYSHLFSQINRTANGLMELGVRENDVITILLPNLPENHYALWGAQAVAIANPINHLLEEKQILSIIRNAESKFIIIHRTLLQKISNLNPSDFKILVVDSLDEGNDFNRYIDKFTPYFQGNQRSFAGCEVAAYFHTGGTTGDPKLAIHSHINQTSNAWNIDFAIDGSENDVYLCGLPLYHVNAVIVTGLATFLAGGEVLLLTDAGYRGKDVFKNFWKIVEKYRVKYFSGVPTIYATLMGINIDKEDVSSLRYGLCGAAPMSKSLIEKFEDRTGIKILEGYGLTEGTCSTSANPAKGLRKAGSIGFRHPYIDQRVAILDGNRYVRDAGIDEVGEIVMKGPNVFPGYKNKADNSFLFTDNGYLMTGDLGKIDEEEYFYITGRRKDLIIRGGHNIDPKIIEEALYKHSSVVMCAAVGMPDKRLGEVPVAYVVLKDLNISEESLIEFCKNEIGEKAAIPKKLFFVPELPITGVGKIFKPALREDATLKSSTTAINEAGVNAYQLKVIENTVTITARASDFEVIQGAMSGFHFEYKINLHD